MSDPLADVLGMVRLAGGVFLSGEFTAPWHPVPHYMMKLSMKHLHERH